MFSFFLWFIFIFSNKYFCFKDVNYIIIDLNIHLQSVQLACNFADTFVAGSNEKQLARS